MGAASGAGLGHAAADQALPALPAQLLPVDLSAVGTENVHVKQPSHRCVILNLHSDCLDCKGIGIQQKNGLISRFLLDFLKIDYRDSSRLQLLPQKTLSQGVTPADQGVILHRPGNVHGKADHGLSVGAQKYPLPVRPALPGFQHFQQCHFHSFLLYRCFFSRSSPQLPLNGFDPLGQGGLGDEQSVRRLGDIPAFSRDFQQLKTCFRMFLSAVFHSVSS